MSVKINIVYNINDIQETGEWWLLDIFDNVRLIIIDGNIRREFSSKIDSNEATVTSYA